MNDSPLRFKTFARWWDRFFFVAMPVQNAGALRIGFGLLLLIHALVLAPDLQRWFGPQGVLTLQAARATMSFDAPSVFHWLPDTPGSVTIVFNVFLIQICCFILGIFSRFQIACIFVWLVSFQHRNPMICDAEDNLFRLAAFFMIFMPLDAAFTIWKRREALLKTRAAHSPIWPLRLLQIQICAVYFSSALLKLDGNDWLNGSAVYYASHIEIFHRFPLPDFFRESHLITSSLTTTTMLLELMLPFALWISDTRRIAIIAGILFHLGLDYSMNLFLFEWLMILGLCTFLTGKDLSFLTGLFRRSKRATVPESTNPANSNP